MATKNWYYIKAKHKSLNKYEKFLIKFLKLKYLVKGLASTYPHFTILSYGENYTRLSPTELSADFAFSSLQQFGQPFLEHYIEAHRLPINILQKVCSLKV
jgi:hypothetical protein